MEQATFHQLLTAAVQNGVSDVHFKLDAPPAVRLSGELRPVKVPALAAQDLERIAQYVLAQGRYPGTLETLTEWDTSYAIEGVARFRASVFRQMGTFAVVLRNIPFHIPNLADLGLPKVVEKVALEPRGLVLVAGITGSGKSTTLAAMIDFMNQRVRKHIVTIEDPIEFVHKDKHARIVQREVGTDTPSFATALRAALRQDPDVILVGEMRDHETVEIAMQAAETGHLVLSTVHTTDAMRTIGRIIGVFPNDVQGSIRMRLSESLRAILCQRLLPHASGKGRVLAAEVLVNTQVMREMIRDPSKAMQVKEYLEKGREVYGTQSFDQHLTALYKAGAISLETALSAASNPSDFQRALSFGE
jgi:twitching motility protein PilT